MIKYRVFGLGERQVHRTGAARMLAHGRRRATACRLQSLMRKGSARRNAPGRRPTARTSEAAATAPAQIAGLTDNIGPSDSANRLQR